MVKKQVLNYLEYYNLLGPKQFGFRNGMGTDDAIAKVTSLIISNLDRGRKCLGIFVDLRKAFDSISHVNLMRKFRAMGMGGRVFSWFLSYLENREQQVKLRDEKSEPLTSQYGIPQGTVIGPLMFIIYVNCMFNLPLRSEIVAYADDTVLVVDGDTWEDAVSSANTDMSIFKKYLDSQLLTLNIEKTVLMKFSLTNANPILGNLTIHEEGCSSDNCHIICKKLEKVHSTRYLGILIDDDMKFKNLIDQTVKRLRKLIYVFLALRDILNFNDIRSVYFALAQSILQYGIVGWGGVYSSTLRPLIIVQRMIIKIILNRPRDYPTEFIHKELKVHPLETIFKINSILAIFKNYKTQSLNSNRYEGVLTIPKFNSSAAQHHFRYLGIKEFNDLPLRIRKISEKHQFKREVKRHFMTWDG
jgi:hypothetical protein